MRINLYKRGDGYDHNHPRMNNTTNDCTKQRFGQPKVNIYMQETYVQLLHDVEYICNALRNPLNLPKDLPALTKLVELLKVKYEDLLDGAYANILLFHINSLNEELKNMSIKFYKYYFKDKEKPIIIEALTKQAANHAIEQIMPDIEPLGYKLSELLDVKVETPIAGVSTKKHKGKNFIWTTEGWVENKEEND